MATKVYKTHGVTVTYNSEVEGVLQALKNATQRGLEAIGSKAETYAKEEITKAKPHADGSIRDAIDTGNLRNKIAHKVVGRSDTKQEVYIGTNVKYAPYVEFGTGLYATGKSKAKKIPWVYRDDKGKWHTTSGQMPHPYLKPAASEHTDEYRNILKDSLQNA